MQLLFRASQEYAANNFVVGPECTRYKAMIILQHEHGSTLEYASTISAGRHSLRELWCEPAQGQKSGLRKNATFPRDALTAAVGAPMKYRVLYEWTIKSGRVGNPPMPELTDRVHPGRES